MNAADLNPGVIVASVTLLCVAGVALTFRLPQRTKNGIGTAFLIPLQLLLLLTAAMSSYHALVTERRLGSWGVALWAGSAFFGAIVTVRDLLKMLSGDPTGGEPRL